MQGAETKENDSRQLYKNMKYSSLGVLGVAFLCHLISFGSTYWGRSNYLASRNEHIGLWRYCTSGMRYSGGFRDNCDDFIDVITHDWQNAAQSFMTLAMFALMGTVAVFVVFTVLPDYQNNFKLFLGCWAVTLTSVLFIGLACASFASKYKDYFAKRDEAFTPDVASLGWSFWLAVAVALLNLLAASLITPDTMLAMQEEARPIRDLRKPYETNA